MGGGERERERKTGSSDGGLPCCGVCVCVCVLVRRLQESVFDAYSSTYMSRVSNDGHWFVSYYTCLPPHTCLSSSSQVPEFGGDPSVFFCGVFDGHGSCGHVIAEDAAAWVHDHVSQQMTEATSGDGGANDANDANDATGQKSKSLALHAIRETFGAFQEKQKDNYDRTILPPVLELKKQFEEEMKMEVRRVGGRGKDQDR